MAAANNDNKFELTITADKISSTDENFSLDNLGAGDNYKPLDVYFIAADDKVNKIRRTPAKNERQISNQTLPRLAFQLFEKKIAGLTDKKKKQFPICRYSPTSSLIAGIFTSVDEFKQYKDSWEYVTYQSANGQQFVIYCWNVFSTLLFVQECLKRFGKERDCFKLIYQEKDGKEKASEGDEDMMPEKLVQQDITYSNPYSKILVESKNIIFRGAPGTGKTYLAKEIAADIVSNGSIKKYAELSAEQNKQIEFVQFHPSYDYCDFVEGLRPQVNDEDDDGLMKFVLQDGVFKAFVDKARKNYEDAQKPEEVIAQEASVLEAMKEFFSSYMELEREKQELETVKGSKFFIKDVDDKSIKIYMPDIPSTKNLTLPLDELKKMLESEKKFNLVKDVTELFGRINPRQRDSYLLPLYNKILPKKKSLSAKPEKQEEKKYVFIIDEINRGEISKIFGELFFAIDPGYRGREGEVSTQYANMHSSDDKFYIPENVYIIGTMNDIDRSVDSFDFAMRRRFRFIELKADDRIEMLDVLDDEKKGEAIARMKALNAEIAQTEGLNENYQIGAAYFRKLKDLNFDALWTDYLCPLLQEYINGMYDEAEIMRRFNNAYNLVSNTGNGM